MSLNALPKVLLFSLTLALCQFSLVIAQQGTVTINSEAGENRLAPGEFLPISIKLVNFGSASRIDVIVDYQILDQYGKIIYTESETVAVETTASFVKRIQLPRGLTSGNYTAKAVLHYPDQQYPAVSQFNFLVGKKIFGFFINEFFGYLCIGLAVLIAGIYAAVTLARRGGSHKAVFHDYSDKPAGEMVYYEMLSDIINNMRERIGNYAIEIAKDIPDLAIDGKTGKIIAITDNPAKIIALLIARYEKLTGQRISFSLRSKN